MNFLFDFLTNDNLLSAVFDYGIKLIDDFLGVTEEDYLRDIEIVELEMKLKEEKRKAKKVEKERNSEIFKAEKENNAKYVISDATRKDLKRLAEVSHENYYDLQNRFQYSMQLAEWALYYISHEDAELIELDKEEKEFVNMVAKLANYGMIFPYENIANINLYNMSTKDTDDDHSRFLVNGVELIRRTNDRAIRSRMDIVKAIRFKPVHFMGRPYYTEEDGRAIEVVSPVPTPEEDTVPRDLDAYVNNVFPVKRDPRMSIEFFHTLEMYIGEFVYVPYFYTLSADGTSPVLNTINPMAGCSVKRTPIDVGSIYGGSNIAIGASYIDVDGVSKLMFVPVRKFPSLINRIVTINSNENLNSREAQYIMSSTSPINFAMLSSNIDFSNTPWIDKLSEVDKIALNANLTNAYNAIKMRDYGLKVRFESFTDVSNFALVSDNDVVLNFSTDRVVPGFRLIVTSGQAYNTPAPMPMQDQQQTQQQSIFNNMTHPLQGGQSIQPATSDATSIFTETSNDLFSNAANNVPANNQQPGNIPQQSGYPNDWLSNVANNVPVNNQQPVNTAPQPGYPDGGVYPNPVFYNNSMGYNGEM